MTYQPSCPAPDCPGELQYVTEVVVVAWAERPERIVTVCVCDTCGRVWTTTGEDWTEVGG
jgi:hypothetical protein